MTVVFVCMCMSVCLCVCECVCVCVRAWITMHRVSQGLLTASEVVVVTVDAEW